jgi:hypothetical protein
MPWEHKFNTAQKILEVYYFGDVTAHELQESTSRGIELQQEQGWLKFLVDASEMTFAASLSDLYDIPNKQYQEEGADSLGRVAIILPTTPKELDAVKFYQIVCRNGGWHVNTFAKRQQAVDWLLAEAL